MIDGNETCWVGLKHLGFFREFDTYEDYQDRNVKKEKPVRVIKESRSEEIQRLKMNYNPKSAKEKEKEESEAVLEKLFPSKN